MPEIALFFLKKLEKYSNCFAVVSSVFLLLFFIPKFTVLLVGAQFIQGECQYCMINCHFTEIVMLIVDTLQLK